MKPKKPMKKKMATFDWTDALNLESRLTEEEIAVRDVSRDYCQESVQYTLCLNFHFVECTGWQICTVNTSR